MNADEVLRKLSEMCDKIRFKPSAAREDDVVAWDQDRTYTPREIKRALLWRQLRKELDDKECPGLEDALWAPPESEEPK